MRFFRATFATQLSQIFLAPDADLVRLYLSQRQEEAPLSVEPAPLPSEDTWRFIPKLRAVPGRGVRRCLRGVTHEDLFPDDAV